MPLTRAYARTLCAANSQTGLVVGDPRLDAQIDQAMRRLVRHYNFFVRREEYDNAQIDFDPTADPLQLDSEDALKLMVLCQWREENDMLEQAAALEARAYALLDQHTIEVFESQNKVDAKTALANSALLNSVTWYAYRLGLDTAGGLATSQYKLRRLVRRAVSWIYQKIYEYQLIERNRVHSGVPTVATAPTSDTDPLPTPLDYETVRLVVQAMALEGAATSADQNPQQLAAQFLQEAMALIVRRLDAELEALRHTAYLATLTGATPGTFGYTVAKLSLEIPSVGLKLSDSEVRRLCNAAEQRIIESGKWKLATYDVTLTVETDGTVALPVEAETVMSAWYCNGPLVIQGETCEGADGSMGLLNSDRRGRGGVLVVRPGEFATGGGSWTKHYFLTGCTREENETLTARCKRRFITKANDSTRMQVQNFAALKNAAQCLLHEGTFGDSIGGVAVRDPKQYAYYWANTVRILSDEVVESRGGEQAAVSMQYGGYGANEINPPL